MKAPACGWLLCSIGRARSSFLSFFPPSTPLRLGHPATELSGGEAQRIKLATELQRLGRGNTLYILDEPTIGLHPSDVEKLLVQLNRPEEAGNTVIVVEHDMHVIAGADWILGIRPGAGEEGGPIVAAGEPGVVAKAKESKTAVYLRRMFEDG